MGVILVALSGAHLVHYLLFRDAYQVAIDGLSDPAFLPIEVSLVVVLIEKVISNQEKRSKLNKLNTVIGAYFSEVGTALLKAFFTVDQHIDRIRSELFVKGTWTGCDFLKPARA
ncbi:MAG: hypothetical protein ACLQAL_04270 [Halobacteriota archaeon]